MVINDTNHAVWRKIVDIVNQTKPMAVGISYYTPLKYVVYIIANLVKEADSDIKVIVGSFHPTMYPEEVIRNSDIDFVVRGEAEIPLLRLIKELKKDKPHLETVPGIYYRENGGQIKNTPPIKMIENLDDLPFLARDLVLNCDYNRYKAHVMTTARGCPYTCTFCADRGLWGGKVRRRSVENVIEEISLIKNNYKISSIEIVDGTFTYDKKYVKAFCKSLIENKLNVSWRCTARYDNLDEELLQIMKQANCSGLYIGLESGSDRVLHVIDKKTTVEQIIRANKMVYDSGIPCAISILLGMPEETKEDLEKTLELMKKVRTDIFDINSYIPLAGTSLYDSMSEEERNSIDWRKTGFKSPNNDFIKTVSQEDFQKYMTEAYEIANKVRNKTIIRFTARRIFSFIPGVINRLR